MDRADLAGAVSGARGKWLADADDQSLDREYVDAICRTEAEVDEVLFKANKERQLRSVRKKWGA